jgi:hypothetical protein
VASAALTCLTEADRQGSTRDGFLLGLPRWALLPCILVAMPAPGRLAKFSTSVTACTRARSDNGICGRADWRLGVWRVGLWVVGAVALVSGLVHILWARRVTRFWMALNRRLGTKTRMRAKGEQNLTYLSGAIQTFLGLQVLLFVAPHAK